MRLTDLLTVSFSSGLWTDKERNKILNEKKLIAFKSMLGRLKSNKKPKRKISNYQTSKITAQCEAVTRDFSYPTN